MNEIDYMDTALDDFLKRFGDTDPNKKIIQNKYQSPNVIKTSQELEDERNRGLLDNSVFTNSEFSKIGDKKNPELRPKIEKIPTTLIGVEGEEINMNPPQGVDVEKSPGLLGTKEMGAGDYIGLGVNAIDTFQGLNQFETSAESGGPGEGGGAILKAGASTFGTTLQATGNPIIAGGAAIISGLATGLAFGKARKKYGKNVIKSNLNKNALEKAKREEEWARSEGLISMGNLKALREKQLGILNT